MDILYNAQSHSYEFYECLYSTSNISVCDFNKNEHFSVLSLLMTIEYKMAFIPSVL